jgi:ubiquinone/menaquinone biosynthesis C-methylase UbiE
MAESATKLLTQCQVEEQLLQYQKYATQFDEMCELVPAYQENIDLLLKVISDLDLPERPRICDLGAGTGNFVCAMAELLPNAHFTHLDSDMTMNAYAASKYQKHGIANWEIVESYIQTASFAENSFDLIVCVNALNTAPPQLPVLRMIRRWLNDDGTLFLIDFGRPQKTLDWTWYMFKHTYKTHGIGRVFKALWNNREAIRQNRRARQDQKAGRMWLHSTEEFGNIVAKAGYSVDELGTCYRNYSDLVIARK